MEGREWWCLSRNARIGLSTRCGGGTIYWFDCGTVGTEGGQPAGRETSRPPRDAAAAGTGAGAAGLSAELWRHLATM
jgi:hypothetical protein